MSLLCKIILKHFVRWRINQTEVLSCCRYNSNWFLCLWCFKDVLICLFVWQNMAVRGALKIQKDFLCVPRIIPRHWWWTDSVYYLLHKHLRRHHEFDEVVQKHIHFRYRDIPKSFFCKSNIFGQKFEAGEKILWGHIRVLESNVLLPMMYPEVLAYGWI